MREKIAVGLAWSKVIGLSIVGVYALAILWLNRDARIEPSLRLVFVRYEKPNALLTIFVASAVSVAGCYLALSFYRSVRTLRLLTAQKKLRAAEKEITSLRAQSVSVATPVGASAARKPDEAGPIPLE